MSFLYSCNYTENTEIEAPNKEFRFYGFLLNGIWHAYLTFKDEQSSQCFVCSYLFAAVGLQMCDLNPVLNIIVASKFNTNAF